MREICGILDVNSFEISTAKGESSSIQAVYRSSSLAEHRCVPNLHRTFEVSNLEICLRTMQPITAGTHLTITYTDSLWCVWIFYILSKVSVYTKLRWCGKDGCETWRFKSGCMVCKIWFSAWWAPKLLYLAAQCQTNLRFWMTFLPAACSANRSYSHFFLLFMSSFENLQGVSWLVLQLCLVISPSYVNIIDYPSNKRNKVVKL